MHSRFAVETLLAPLPDGVGPDPRSAAGDMGGYLSIKDARAEARRLERDALASGDLDVAPLLAGIREWREVARGGSALLESTVKDLQTAAWLCEAWLRTEGFEGLAAGFAVMAGLVEAYWEEGLHPQEDEDGPETRIAPLSGLFGRDETGTLLQPIKLLPLTDDPAKPVALWTVESAQAQSPRHEDPELRDEQAARRQERIVAIDQAIACGSPEFAATTIAAIEDALGQLDRLMAAVDAQTTFGRFGSQVARPLEDALALLRVAHEAAAPRPAPAPSLGPVEAAAPSPLPAPSSAPAAMTRESALATLLEVAAFFDRNEPQSLIPVGLRDMVRRAYLPLNALLEELLPEADQRSLFLMRAGIKTVTAGDDGGYS